MAVRFPNAKITDLVVTIEPGPIETPLGPVAWANVDIHYASGGVEPSLTIRVPVSWSDSESAADRQAQALRRARQLIDHACTSPALAPETPAGQAGVLEGTALEGLSQELGIRPPTTRPAKGRGR